MAKHTVGIIMNGVTGRMGTNQHLVRSICAIREQGGVACANGDIIWPEPVLVGRNPDKLAALTKLTDIEATTTDVDAVLKDDKYQIYFDAQTTGRRFDAVKKAVAAGKHVYCEKPVATTAQQAFDLFDICEKAGAKNGVVQDKLWLPGLMKLQYLIDTGFFGKILSVRGEFGYWVYEGEHVPLQRPSWNYRKEDGGGIIVDMVCHWHYVLANLFGEPTALSCLGATHVPTRYDEQGKPYDATSDDAAYVTFELDGGVIAQFNSSWCVRVRRDDLLTIQVDGTEGTAVAGLRKCRVQSRAETPRAVWNPDIDNPIEFFDGWMEVPDKQEYDNAFKVQWELFLKHVVQDDPFPWTIAQGARGVQLAEKAIESWEKRAWVDIPK